MKLVDLKFQPGIDKQDTAYSAGDQRKYVDSNLVRFHYGKPERWNGWSYLPDPNKTASNPQNRPNGKEAVLV